jgi:hypothetical protein
MSAIGTATSYASDISALLLSNSSDASAADSASPTTQSAPGSDPNSSDRGPATSVQLSDKVKAILAQASSDAVVAARLENFVQSQRTNNAATSQSPSGDSSSSTTQTTDVNQAFAQLTDSSAQPADDSSGPVEAVHDFSNGVKFNGFTLGVVASAESGSSRIELIGPNGLSFFDFRFGTSDEASGASGVKDGMSVSSSQHGNVEYVTISQSEAAAASTTVSTGDQTASNSAAIAQTSKVTFAIDFSTGSIQATETNSLMASSTSSFSTVA